MLLCLMLSVAPTSDANQPIPTARHEAPLPNVDADPDYCDPNTPNHCAYPLGAGEKAPFAGTLLTPELAIDLGQKADNCDRAKILQLERDVDDAEIDASGCESKYDDQSRAIAKMGLIAQQAAEDCDKELRACQPAFYEKWWFGAILGVVVGGGVVGFAVSR